MHPLDLFKGLQRACKLRLDAYNIRRRARCCSAHVAAAVAFATVAAGPEWYSTETSHSAAFRGILLA